MSDCTCGTGDDVLHTCPTRGRYDSTGKLVGGAKERGILFSAPMVRALLAGAKTQTRRALRDGLAVTDVCGGGVEPVVWWPRDALGRVAKCPYGEPMDRLWVRETWAAADCMYHDHELDTPSTIAYFADRSARTMGKPVPGYDLASWNWNTLKKRPSIYMPRWASRITLEVTDVRVQRLQDISEEDAKAEGVLSLSEAEVAATNPGGKTWSRGPATARYELLWDAINGEGSWASNPFVWAISFKRVTS